MDDPVRAVLAELERNGIKGRVEKGKGHPRVYFDCQGRERFYVLPCTGSDRRHGIKNALADVRRMIGVSAARPKSDKPKKGRRRKPVVVSLPPDTITPGADGLQGLLHTLEGTDLHKETRRMQSERAWKGIWSAACREVCGYGSVTAAFKASLNRTG